MSSGRRTGQVWLIVREIRRAPYLAARLSRRKPKFLKEGEVSLRLDLSIPSMLFSRRLVMSLQVAEPGDASVRVSPS